jgi:predicted Na+-dependent transporter
MLIVKIGLLLALTLAKFGFGSEITWGDVRFLKGKPALLGRSVLAALVLVPLAYFIVIRLVQPSLPVAVALSILAASPAVPLAIGMVRKAGGNISYSASLKFVTAVLAVVTTPVTIAILSQAFGFEAQARPLFVAAIVFFFVILPIGAGILVRERVPGLAGFAQFAHKIGFPILLVVVVLILATSYRGLLETDLQSYLAIILAVGAGYAVAHFLAPRPSDMKISLAMEAGTRNFGLSLMIISFNFKEADPLTVMVPILVMSLLVNTIYTKWQAKKGTVTGAEPSEGGPEQV